MPQYLNVYVFHQLQQVGWHSYAEMAPQSRLCEHHLPSCLRIARVQGGLGQLLLPDGACALQHIVLFHHVEKRLA